MGDLAKRLWLSAFLIVPVLALAVLLADRSLTGAASPNSITSPDTSGTVGTFSSLALDADGNPVVSYRDATSFDLKILHCDDPNCSGGGESVTSPDTTGDVGEFTSLALDGSGSPVVSYYDTTGGDLKVMHCDDPNCSGGGESITSPDTTGVVGLHTSLALDTSGNPVVSYYSSTANALKVLHCGDANCSSGNVVTFPDSSIDDTGSHSSLELTAAGFPVVSYYGADNGNLKLLRCTNANCTGVVNVTSPDTALFVGDVHVAGDGRCRKRGGQLPEPDQRRLEGPALRQRDVYVG